MKKKNARLIVRLENMYCSNISETREAYLIERGQTLDPLGLNKKEET